MMIREQDAFILVKGFAHVAERHGIRHNRLARGMRVGQRAAVGLEMVEQELGRTLGHPQVFLFSGDGVDRGERRRLRAGSDAIDIGLGNARFEAIGEAAGGRLPPNREIIAVPPGRGPVDGLTRLPGIPDGAGQRHNYSADIGCVHPAMRHDVANLRRGKRASGFGAVFLHEGAARQLFFHQPVKNVHGRVEIALLAQNVIPGQQRADRQGGGVPVIVGFAADSISTPIAQEAVWQPLGQQPFAIAAESRANVGRSFGEQLLPRWQIVGRRVFEHRMKPGAGGTLDDQGVHQKGLSGIGLEAQPQPSVFDLHWKFELKRSARAQPHVGLSEPILKVDAKWPVGPVAVGHDQSDLIGAVIQADPELAFFRRVAGPQEGIGFAFEFLIPDGSDPQVSRAVIDAAHALKPGSWVEPALELGAEVEPANDSALAGAQHAGEQEKDE